MRDVTRRLVLKTGASLAAAGTTSQGVLADHEESSDPQSPQLDRYVQPLPIPETRTPDGEHAGASYHRVELAEAQHSFHPDLPDTTIWGYDGQFPGPVIEGQQGEPLAVEFDNSGMPDEHLFAIDRNIGGTTTENYANYDGPVPDVRHVTHFHGLDIPEASDGQADMWTSPDGVEGPRYSRAVQMPPHEQERMTSSYHGHARGISRLNNYAGLIGPYYIRGQREDPLGLPDGEYDVPLVLADRTFNDDGSLYYPDVFQHRFVGDTPTVNGAAWPYMEVEPRRYRLRPINLSNGLTYDLALESDGAGGPPTIYQFASGHGYLDDVVSIGPGGDMGSLTIAPFERGDVIVDFSDHAGETITVTTSGIEDDEGDEGAPFQEVMQFRVRDSGGGSDPSVAPTDLQLPANSPPDPSQARTTRPITLDMDFDGNYMVHRLNGAHFGDPITVKPLLGSTEVWELHNHTGHMHPIHLHLVTFRVIGRGEDGTAPPRPNERGPKDEVQVYPGETVRIAVEFERAGQYPFHCHILEHEEHEMMRPFEVVTDPSDATDGGASGGVGGGFGGFGFDRF